MSAEEHTVYALGARLGVTATTVEAMSHREVSGWLRFFGLAGSAPANDDDGALPLSQVPRDVLRSMFPG